MLDTYMKTNFPTDNDGRLCGVDKDVRAYPYVYFVQPTNFVIIISYEGLNQPKNV